MKVNHVILKNAQHVSKKRLSNNEGLDFASFIDDSSSVVETATTATISQFKPIISTEQFSPEQNQEEAKQRAQDILSTLAELQQDLVISADLQSNIMKLSNILNHAKLVNTHSALNDLVEEIELRAAVELAKLQYSNK